jgi:transcription elongation factor Elf1
MAFLKNLIKNLNLTYTMNKGGLDMNRNKSGFNCYYCNSTILHLTFLEIQKLSGLCFRCECCGHENKLKEKGFVKSTHENDPYNNIFSADQILLKSTPIRY